MESVPTPVSETSMGDLRHFFPKQKCAQLLESIMERCQWSNKYSWSIYRVPNHMLRALEMEPLKGWWRLNEVGPDLCPYKKKKRELSPFMRRGKAPWRHSKKVATCKPGRDLTRNWIFQHLQNHEKINFCCLGHTVCNILLRQPEHTQTHTLHHI